MVLCIECENDAIFVFFDTELSSFGLEVDSEGHVCVPCQRKELFLGHAGMGAFGKGGHLKVSQMDLR
jgi:hypothetical protein